MTREVGFLASTSKLLKPLLGIPVPDLITQLPGSLIRVRDRIDAAAAGEPIEGCSSRTGGDLTACGSTLTTEPGLGERGHSSG
jgi:hypothetical protein